MTEERDDNGMLIDPRRLNIDAECPDPDLRDATLQRIGEAIAGRSRRNGRDGGRHYPIATEPTAHELRIVICLSHGLGTRGTADALGMTQESVKTGLMRARDRVGAKNKTQLVAICLRNGWIE